MAVVISPIFSELSPALPKPVSTSHTFEQPGTQFVVLCGVSSREYLLSRDVAFVSGAELIDEVDSPSISRLNLLGTLTADINALSITTTLRHSTGYDLDPALNGQSSVGSYTTFDMFANVAHSRHLGQDEF